METICLLPRKLGMGGPGSFQMRLADALRKQGIQVTFDSDDPAVSAILVVGGTKQLNNLKNARRRGVRIVQRLNGMNWVHWQKFTGVRHFLRAEVNNYILATIRNKIAHRIVYQSQFTRDWWTRVHGATKAADTVIYNGVDLNEFSPSETQSRPGDRYRMLLVEGSLEGGYEGGLSTAVRAAEILNERLDRPMELMIVGKASENLRRQVSSTKVSLVWRGVVPRSDIPEIDRSAHILFSSDINAACPNSVIEALACGLPVVGYDTGALPELLIEGSGRVAAYGSNPWKLEPPNLYALVDAVQEVLKNQAHFSAAARLRAEAAFDIRTTAEAYRRILLDE